MMFARKVGREELGEVGEETKGKLNIDEERGRQAAEKEKKNNEILDQSEKQAALSVTPQPNQEVKQQENAPRRQTLIEKNNLPVNSD